MKRSTLLTPFLIIAWSFICISNMSCADPAQAKSSKTIPFIHKTHVEKYRISDCGTCHKYDSIGRFKGLPTVGDCTACHNREGDVCNNDHMAPRKKTIFDSFTDGDRPWAYKAQKPDLVYYSHKIVMSAKSEDIRLKTRCATCHGDKADSTGVAAMKGKPLMDQCIDCHEAFDIVNKCPVCH